MKKSFLRQLFTALLLLCGMVASAQDFEVDGVFYRFISIANKTVAVTYSGSSVDAVANEYTGTVVIPATVIYNGITYNVTSIGEHAFYNCSGLTSVTIPNSVTSIASGAFYGCSGLTSVTIPESVTSIGHHAFEGCSGLTSVTIPNSVTRISDNAFNNCSGLTSVTIPESVTSIGISAFYGCTGLTSVTIPNGVKSIEWSAFEGCTGLTSVTIPESVTSIGISAFYGCSGLKEVHINDLVAWCKIDFHNGSSNPLYHVHNLYLNGEKVINLVIPDDVTEIKDYAFYNCSGVGLVTLEGVTPPALSANAFSSSISFVVPATAVDTYKNDANWSDYALRICNADYATQNVDVEAEEGSSALLKEIGDANTASVCDLTIKGSINSYDVIILRDKMPNLRYLDMSEAAVVASSKAFYKTSCTGENDLSNDAFDGLSNLLSVKLPKDLVRIGNYMFSGCSGLTGVTIPNSVTSIGNCAFYGCSGLTGVTIPNGVTSIGGSTFSKCSSLNEIKLPPPRCRQ